MSEKKYFPWQKYEQGFLILLTAISVYGLYQLFDAFVLPIVFAIVITCASYPLFEKINNKIKNRSQSSLIMTIGISILFILPIVYLISVASISIFEIYNNNPDFLTKFNFSKVSEIKDLLLSYIPINESTRDFLSLQIDKNAKNVFIETQTFLISTSKSIIDNSTSGIYFMIISLFSMFFFFRDGKETIEKIKIITPLHDHFDSLLMQELYSLCGILTVSVCSIALIQGVSFGLLTSFMGLNWFFIAVAISITSFIPVVGSVLVWIPLSIYLLAIGHHYQAITIIFWGAIINGIVIDNILRPWITGKVSKMFNSTTNTDLSDFNPLDNTFIIILSTFGGIMLFGVIGLFLGPIIAAISITVLDLYVLRIQSAEKDTEDTDNKENNNTEK